MTQLKITLLTCTHNGAESISGVLEAIANQTDVPREQYEVLVIDNASSDRTAEIAATTLQQLNLNGRVLFEPCVGKVHAFVRGVKEAKGELISIIDDDNFIQPGFIHHTLEVFNQYADVGVVGSNNNLHIDLDQPVPAWFSLASNRYACSQPTLEEIEERPDGIILAQFAVVAGAGSTFRAKPLRDCLAKGYQFFNDTQRNRNMKVTGEDLELCWLMRSLGYRFAFDPRIQVRHAIKPERLTLKYFERLCKTQGAGSPGADPFMFTYKCPDRSLPLQWTWQWQLLSKLKRYVRTVCFPQNYGTTDEERQFINWIERLHCLGSIERILSERDKYTQHIRQVATGAWTEFRVR